MPAPSRIRTQFRVVLRESELGDNQGLAVGGNTLYGEVATWQLSPIVERVLTMDNGDVLANRVGLAQLEDIDLTLVSRATLPAMIQSFTGEVEIDIENAELRSDRASNHRRRFDNLRIVAVGEHRGIDFGTVAFNQEQSDTFTIHVRELTISQRLSQATQVTTLLSVDSDDAILTVGGVDLTAELRTALGL